MGSLKDEMKGLKEDHQHQEKTDDGQSPGGSESNDLPGGPKINMCQESTAQRGHEPKLHMHASYTEEGSKNQLSKCQVPPGEDINNLNSIKDFARTDTIPLTQQPEADKTTKAAHNNTTISNKLLNDGGGVAQEEDKIMGQCREKEAEVQSVSVAVPSTPDPRSPDPRSPAPYGQHHMRTQVSLEVVQCRSAATSPMTPPEGGHSFFFPSSFGGSAAVGTDTKDVELQVGRQVECCSVATSPMTPKTPSTTAFPELIGREMVQKNGQVKSHVQQRVSGQQESFPVTRGLEEVESEISGVLKLTTSEGLNEGAAGVLMESAVTLEETNQQCKQQRMGSMDQDITILVTHYGIDEEGEEEKTESLFPVEPEMVKIEEYEEVGENESDGKEKISGDNAAPGQAQEANSPQNKLPVIDIVSDSSQGSGNKDGCALTDDVFVTKCRVPESPAPSGCHNMRTQVSLEVVQCQSAATSPMTPPDGNQAFSFPSSFGRCAAVGAETKDAELQVGQQLEFRSVATAPMTPRTPTATTFPELRKEANIGEKMAEVKDAVDLHEEKEKVEEAKEDKTEAINLKENGEEKCEEPVQEVSWDEKGMTWEVYGAVVEVAVLGSAIQKHLEKQVKKQKNQPSMPPPPPLNPSATPLTPEPIPGASGSGKGRAGKRGERDGKVNRRRRNPFRLLMENMQQPHCCSRAHTSE